MNVQIKWQDCYHSNKLIMRHTLWTPFTTSNLKDIKNSIHSTNMDLSLVSIYISHIVKLSQLPTVLSKCPPTLSLKCPQPPTLAHSGQHFMPCTTEPSEACKSEMANPNEPPPPARCLIWSYEPGWLGRLSPHCDIVLSDSHQYWFHTQVWFGSEPTSLKKSLKTLGATWGGHQSNLWPSRLQHHYMGIKSLEPELSKAGAT